MTELSICSVCGTDRTGMNNDEIHRRILTRDKPGSGTAGVPEAFAVRYCADVVGCGEAAAMEYLSKVAASEQITDEMRAELQTKGSVNLGFDPTVAGIMQMLDDLGLDPFDATLFYTNEDDGVHLNVSELL